jgi:hypothetical protein
MTRRIFCKVLLVVIAIFGVLILSGVLMAQGRSDWALEHVIDVQERNTARLMAIDGVEGTAVGFNLNERLAIKVFTSAQEVRGIPRELEGVPVQPVITGKIYALAPGGIPGKPDKPPKPDPDEPEEPVDPTSRFDRPVPIGVSTGHPNITAGTIGCRVTDGSNVYALSNNHVYADENNASIGDAVIQPGTFDGGSSSADDIGNLSDFEPIDFSGGDNTIDAAIAEIIIDKVDGDNIPRVGNATPSDGYEIPSLTTAVAVLRQKVQKYGRTTGLTKGRVSEINATVWVGYGNGKLALFTEQIMISGGSFSAGGDSGSLVVTQGGKNPVGLLFAGGQGRTVANPIEAVLDAFGVTVDGE